MKKNKLWSAMLTLIIIIILISAYSIGGFVQGQESRSSQAGGEHRTENSDDAERAGANALAPDQTYDVTRNGLRLVLSYDAPNNQFIGTVENTTNSTLTRVRVEIHLSNGLELGPTAPADLAAGQVLDIVLDAGAQAFDAWTPHAEVGAGEGAGGEGAGEHGGQGPEGAEGGGESGDPSSPILALDESWDGIVNGLRTSMAYDPARGAFTGFVENPGDTTLCFVQIELNLKQGTKTVVELGPQPVGDLAPGQRLPVELLMADEPLAADIAFAAWEIHPEVFDCGGPGPVDSEGASEGNGEGAGEHGGRGGEGLEGSSGAEGTESGSGGDAAEGSGGDALAPDQIYDVTVNGARLVMRYDEANNRFIGKVVNMTEAALTRARVEIHLSNGLELGPTKPTDIPPGYQLSVVMPATDQPFDTWAPHAEFGLGEGGGAEGAGEHGGRAGGEGRGEHGGRSGGEGRGEHGGGSEGGGG
ncbi:MAG: hypothetical protein OXG39_07765 [Chloroflexi bacterium]|nr:hypothetical protein [Chloroflexota bacterium]